MKTPSFIQKIIQERGGGIRFVKALENYKHCWFYLKIDEAIWADYKEQLKSGRMNVADYGEILESGWGEYPPEDVIRRMKEEYGFITPANS